MLVVLLFALLLILIAVILLAVLVDLVIILIQHLKKRADGTAFCRVKKKMIALLIACIACAGFVWMSQLAASTPAILDENGAPIEGSIAELRQVTLNGRKEWISIRGKDKTKPVLLFLAGGPGGSQMAAVRYDLAALESDFVVVNWDQPGSGKSYYAMKTKDITVDTYLEDGYALTKYLCENFEQEKIYLVGESWGSALGILMADKAPELYYAFVGTGQMVSFLDTESMDYELALSMASENGDTKTVNELIANGKPPYYGKDVTWKSAVYLNYLSTAMTHNLEIYNGGYNTFRDLFASEYGILDKINYLRGIVNTFNAVYPQLYDMDFRTDYTELDIPVYFFIGKHDINAPISLTEEYYEILNAPVKELVWFEHSGHSPWINESDRFVEQLIRCVK